MKTQIYIVATYDKNLGFVRAADNFEALSKARAKFGPIARNVSKFNPYRTNLDLISWIKNDMIPS